MLDLGRSLIATVERDPTAPAIVASASSAAPATTGRRPSEDYDPIAPQPFGGVPPRFSSGPIRSSGSGKTISCDLSCEMSASVCR